MIQILTYSGNEKELQGEGIKLNKIHDAEALDSFEINIINLQDNKMWRTRERGPVTIDTIYDFISLSKMIKSSKQSNIIIFLPQNGKFTYNTWQSEQAYWKHQEFKDTLGNFQAILGQVFQPLSALDIIYENTTTIVGNNKVAASFHFDENTEYALTKSEKSNKPTTVEVEGKIISTLNISNCNEVQDFLSLIGLIKEKSKAPEWMEGINMFDDDSQLKIIQENNKAIETANENISNAMEVINQNKRYKSILYTNGDELVEVVFEILENMLGCDLSEFTDKKKEDFKFVINDKVFIGEIKGVTPNVKKMNVSQLDVHVQEYLDDSDVESKNIVALLIINHQRNKPISAREGVNDEVIKLAERNGSLIVETITLLRLFEQYLLGKMDRDECIDTLANTTGLLAL